MTFAIGAATSTSGFRGSSTEVTAAALGLAEDWGTVGSGVVNGADLASVAIATGLRIDLGQVP